LTENRDGGDAQRDAFETLRSPQKKTSPASSASEADLVGVIGFEPTTSTSRTKRPSSVSPAQLELGQASAAGRTEGRTTERGIDESSANRVRTAGLLQPSIRPRVGEFWKLTPEERAALAEELERRRRQRGSATT